MKKNFDNKLKGTGTRKFSQRQHVIIEGLMDLYKPRKPHTVGFNINLSCGCKARYAEAKPSKGDLLFCRKHNDYRLAVWVNEEEFLAAMKQPLRGLARRLTSDAQRHEELCQEGWIAVWKAWKKKPDATFSFYYQAADWRMRGILTGLRALEGQPARSAAHPPEQLVSELPEYASLEDEFTRVVEEIDRLYHEGALVREALSVLTPRQLEFVTLRYFEERTLPEIRERLGYPPGDKKVLNIWHDRNGARDRLREQLGGQK